MKVFTLLLVSLTTVGAFAPSSQFGVRFVPLQLALHHSGLDDVPLHDRRDIFSKVAVTASVVGVSAFFPFDAIATEGSGIGTDPNHPIVVVGAGGKVRQTAGYVRTRKADGLTMTLLI
jgi:hypothetical protein